MKLPFLIVILLLSLSVFASEVSRLLEAKNYRGIEIIINQSDDNSLGSSGGHAFIRIVTDQYYNDVGVSFAADVKGQEIGWGIMPGLISGEYSSVMQIDPFTKMWENYIKVEKRGMQRYALQLSIAQVESVLLILNKWESNRTLLGDYKLLSSNCVVLIYRLLQEAKIISKQNAPVTPFELEQFIYRNKLSLFPSTEVSFYNEELQALFSLLNRSAEDLQTTRNWPVNSFELIQNYLNAHIDNRNQELFVKKILFLFEFMPLSLRKDLVRIYNYRSNSKFSFEDVFELNSLIRFLNSGSRLDFKYFKTYFENLSLQKQLEYFLLYQRNRKDYDLLYPDIAKFLEDQSKISKINEFKIITKSKIRMLSSHKSNIYLAICGADSCKYTSKRFLLNYSAQQPNQRSRSLYNTQVLDLESSLLYIQQTDSITYSVYSIVKEF